MQQDKDLLPMPHSTESEQAVLGTSLVDVMSAKEVCSSLNEDDFYTDRNKQIFSAIKKLMSEGDKIDIALVNNKIKDSGAVVDCIYLMELVENWSWYKETIKNNISEIKGKAALRRVINTAQKIQVLSSKASRVEEVQLEISRLNSEFSRRTGNGLISLSALSVQAEQGLARPEPDLKWGIKAVDHQTGGIRRGETTVIGARTSQGKTSTTLNIALANLKAGHKVAYLSFENTEQVVPRLSALDSKIPLDWFLRPYLRSGEERKMAAGAIKRVEAMAGLRVYDRITFERLEASLALEPADIVIVDYIQKYSIKYTEHDNRHISVSRAMAQAYDIALNNNCSTLVLSQISRREEKSKYRSPTLEELKESGDIENFADNCLLLWWPWREQLDESKYERRRYLITIAKTKLGEPMKIWVDIVPETLCIVG